MSPSYASVSVAVQKAFHNPYLKAVALGIAIGFFPIACEFVVMSSLPRAISGCVSMLGIFVGVILFLVTLVGLVFRGGSRISELIWIAGLCALLSSVPAMLVSREIRKNGFQQMAERTKPLITAIKKFEKQKGHAPEALAELVPEFLPAVPTTGIGAYPEYRYEQFEDDSDPWELSVRCGGGFLNWDEFFYLPSENYGKRVGGCVEPAGTWAYFYE